MVNSLPDAILASYFCYFIIAFSDILHEEGRIQIDSYKSNIRHIGISHLTPEANESLPSSFNHLMICVCREK